MTARWLPSLFCLGLAGLGNLATAAVVPLPENIDFNRDIRPILSANCYQCHGPDKDKRKASLRLDTRDGLFSEPRGLPTVVPGKPDASELYLRITTPDKNQRMPDPKSGKALSPREVSLIQKWIEQGAAWKGHWAYLQPQRPEVPGVQEPR